MPGKLFMRFVLQVFSASQSVRVVETKEKTPARKTSGGRLGNVPDSKE
jgi:hypothetical protein